MKKMKNNKILKKISFLFLCVVVAIFFVSCEQVESVPDASDIVIQDITGTWVVDMTYDGDDAGTNTISIYNSSTNDTSSMWLDDQEHSWGLKAKVPLNYEALTFEGSNLDELYYEVTVNITKGVIVKNGATTPSGEVVDSIYFEAEFSDIPGEIWVYSGYKSTGKIIDLP